MTRIFCLGVIFMGLLATAQAAEKARGPLTVHPTNPRYFTDGSGKAIYLTGSHWGWELQDDSWDTFSAFDYDAYLDFLQAHNHNLIRMWVAEHTRWREATEPKAIAHPMPYKRTGPGNALDGQPKFDLDQFDEAFFSRMRSRVIAAGDRGIYVSIMLFQGVSLWEGKDYWFGHFFNASNNINGVDGDLNGDGKVGEAHSLADPDITRRQEIYVRKVIDTVNDLDNVLYEISNEDGIGSTEWQYHMINYIKDYEAGKSKRHPVGMTFRYPGGTNSELFSSPADWISPGRATPSPYDYLKNPPPAEGTKVIISDTDHVKAYTEDAVFPWKSFLRGHNTLVLDKLVDMSSESPYEPIRKAMGYTRMMADRMNLAQMEPRSDLASTAYCLAALGEEYLVYLPDGGKVTVDFSHALGKVAVEWLNPLTGKTTAGEAIMGGAQRTLETPFQGHAVLYLKAGVGSAIKKK